MRRKKVGAASPKNRVQFSVRMREPLRKRIIDAAEKNGLSMNEEAVERLENSFRADDSAAAALGPPHIRNVAKAVAAMIIAVEDRTGKKYTDDRETFLAAQLAIAGVFGIPYVAPDELSADNRQVGEGVARDALAQLGQSGEAADQWIDAMILPKLLATEKLRETQK